LKLEGSNFKSEIPEDKPLEPLTILFVIALVLSLIASTSVAIIAVRHLSCSAKAFALTCASSCAISSTSAAPNARPSPTFRTNDFHMDRYRCVPT